MKTSAWEYRNQHYNLVFKKKKKREYKVFVLKTNILHAYCKMQNTELANRMYCLSCNYKLYRNNHF